MTRTRYIWLGLLLTLMAATFVRMRTATRARNHVVMMRDSVHSLRRAADACANELERRKAAMTAYSERVDSLRDRIGALEALHARGVPADSYDIYMATFDSYNRGAAEWDEPAGALRATLQSCRATTERHNILVDSLRGLLH